LKKKLLILGSTGMVGSAVFRKAKKSNYKILAPNRKQLNLFFFNQVRKYLKDKKPDIIILCAAKVGGIYANSNYKADFMFDNLIIQNNVISLSHEFKIKKLVFLGSSCIYPRNSKQPIKEEYLLTSELEKTNESYAVAKIAGIKLIEAYRAQYGDNFISVMPTNIYGENDNFHINNSHVIPGLIAKIFDAFLNKKKKVELWGTGKPLRDFLYVDDLAEGILFLTKKYNSSEIINLGSGTEISIKKLAVLISKIIGFKGIIIYNNKYPDGTPRKILDITKVKKLGWRPKHTLEKGLQKTVEWYIENHKTATRK
jgi:GDP-L-fucose synthase